MIAALIGLAPVPASSIEKLNGITATIHSVGEALDRFGRRPQDVCLKVYNAGKGDWWMRLVADQSAHGVPAYSAEREATFTYCGGFIDGLREKAKQ